jgi:hypothetical protein
MAESSDSDEGDESYKPGALRSLVLQLPFLALLLKLCALAACGAACRWLSSCPCWRCVQWKVRRAPQAGMGALFDCLDGLQPVSTPRSHCLRVPLPVSRAIPVATHRETEDSSGRSDSTTTALKVQKSASHYTDAAKDEIEILHQLKSSDPARAHHAVQLLDNFCHTGPHGTHVCMVFEMMGQNLLSLIKYFNYGGIPLDAVKVIAKQICEGLDYIHADCSLIHTDLKPENVLLCLPHRDLEKIQTLAAAAYSAAAATAAKNGSSDSSSAGKNVAAEKSDDGDGVQGATTPVGRGNGRAMDSAEFRQLSKAVEKLLVPWYDRTNQRVVPVHS